ncbi:cytochrome C [Nitrogeniibacter mangrovi]|uniref:Cytochrome C n=1 Tax=Nitrogeniibacter mangrovi TaxID=2016596 RepID=A0A6C1AZC7_9RHOO|nr:cytochrome C [Nitrogeniibacter mangrovi]QID16483.1 cytochrome C [Nitrogeniibacter mangrovi]
MKRTLLALSLGLLAVAGARADAPAPSVERGRYLIAVAGCNDCHTPRFAQLGAAIPESERFTGMAVGFSGPWGVSYPGNLRLRAAAVGEDEWLARVRAGGRPPMPWNALQAMTEADQRSVFRYLRALGPAGAPTPAALPPGAPIPTPHFVFVPQAPTAVGLAPGRP